MLSSKPSRNGYRELVPLCFVYYFVLMMILPLSNQVIVSIVCENLGSDDCSNSEVSAEASMISLYCSLAFNIPALLLAGPYGSLADRYGRRIVLLIPLLGLIFCMSLYFAIAYFRFTSFFFIFLIANLTQGLCGGNGVFQMGLFTYASDVTEDAPDARTGLFSVIESCMFIAKVLGPVIGGVWAKYRGFAEPLMYGSFMLVALGVWAYIAIPESLHVEAKVRSNKITFNPTKTFKNLYHVFLLKYDSGSNPIPYVMFAYFIILIAAMGNFSVFTFYVITKFGMNSELIGYYLALEGGLQTISMLFLPYCLEKILKYKIDNIYWVGAGYFFRSMSYLAISLCTNATQLFFCAGILILTGPYYPRNRVLLSNSVTSANQATMQSAIAAVDGLGSVMNPLITLIYSLTVDQSPSTAYYVMSSLVFLASMVVLYTTFVPAIFRNLPESRERSKTSNSKDEFMGAESIDRTYSATEPLLSAQSSTDVDANQSDDLR